MVENEGEIELLRKIEPIMKEISHLTYYYPFFNHRRISPTIEELLLKLEPLLKEWKEKFGKVKEVV